MKKSISKIKMYDFFKYGNARSTEGEAILSSSNQIKQIYP